MNATTCAVLSDDQVRCFGYGLVGTIGNSNNIDIGDAGAEMGDNLPVAPLW